MATLSNVTDSTFESEVLGAQGAVLVDFWAEWCVPCKMLAPVLERVAGELGDQVTIVKLDVQANPETPTRLGVLNLPTMILFRAGQELKRFGGAMPAGKLKQQLLETLA
ncbi:MAG: thioredoxin [Chloroflexi bacterium]|jgi:thioredoxin 1|nr:thioredoxin [Chloroflexota bacterium]